MINVTSMRLHYVMYMYKTIIKCKKYIAAMRLDYIMFDYRLMLE